MFMTNGSRKLGQVVIFLLRWGDQ